MRLGSYSEPKSDGLRPDILPGDQLLVSSFSLPLMPSMMSQPLGILFIHFQQLHRFCVWVARSMQPVADEVESR